MKLRLCLFAGLVAAFGFAPVANAQGRQPAVVSRIAFGSCADQNKPCPIWEKIGEAKPDLLVLLGDNIYADIEDGKLKPSTPQKMAQCYAELAALPAFQKLKAAVPMMATWDDHDYGNNDAGVEWPHKDDAQKQFLDFFGVPADSPRRAQKGIYSSDTFGPEGKRVQVILLDARYFRSPVKKEKETIPGTTIRPYIPNTDPDATVLGEEQWKWLEAELKKPADVRLIGSGIQVVSDDHPFEKWNNFPLEREKLYRVIRDSGAKGVVVLSGDRHLGEIAVDTKAVGYPLYDVTASGFNQASKNYRDPEACKSRVAAMPWGNNFGMVNIDWDSGVLSLQLRHEDGEIACQARVPIAKLQKGGAAKPKEKDKDKPAAKLPEGTISPVDALKKKEGDEVSIQFEVAAGRAFEGKRILLNSDKDFKSDDNFTVVLNAKGMTGKWKDATFETFKGKTIRAKGKLATFQGKLQLQIDDAANLELVEEKEEKKDK